MAFAREEAFRLLEKASADGRLGHAYLICGEPGSDVSGFADEVAGMYLGKGVLHVGQDPDYHALAPGSKSRRILTEQIRELEEAIHRTPEKGDRKVAVIRNADRMVPNAANAFLKTLEEPPSGTLLLLTTELPEALLETIRSRCLAVVLRRSGAAPVDPSAERLADFLNRVFAPGGRLDATAAFSMSRLFRDLLEEAREEVSERIKEELSAEKSHYGKTTDADLDGREEVLKARAEADVLARRSMLVDVVADFVGSRLRTLHEKGGEADSGESRTLLRRMDALVRMRGDLERGVQEALVLEAGFLEFITLRGSE